MRQVAIYLRKSGGFVNVVGALATPEFDQLLLTLAILQKHGGGTQTALASKMGMKKQQLNQIIKRTNENPTMDLLLKMAAVGPELTPPIAIEFGDLFRPDVIHAKLASVSQIQTQKSVNLRTPGLTGSDRPSSYTPATNVPSDARSVDVASLSVALSALERRFNTLEESLSENIAIVFEAYNLLRLRAESLRSARDPDAGATGTDPRRASTTIARYR